jgi:hypothetical protein
MDAVSFAYVLRDSKIPIANLDYAFAMNLIKHVRSFIDGVITKPA